jgi:hypothetical protein
MTLIERLAYLLIIAVLTSLVTTKDHGHQFCLDKGKQEKFVIQGNGEKSVNCYIRFDEENNTVIIEDCGVAE